MIASTPRLATSVIANFRQVVKVGDMRIHPIVTRLVEPEALERIGAERMEGAPKGGTSDDWDNSESGAAGA